MENKQCHCFVRHGDLHAISLANLPSKCHNLAVQQRWVDEGVIKAYSGLVDERSLKTLTIFSHWSKCKRKLDETKEGAVFT